MEALDIVLDAVVSVWELFTPLLRELHLFEISIGSIFVLFGLRLISPIVGHSIATMPEPRRSESRQTLLEDKGDK